MFVKSIGVMPRTHDSERWPLGSHATVQVIGDKEAGFCGPDLQALIEAKKNVVAMHSRMRAQYWPNGKEEKHGSRKL